MPATAHVRAPAQERRMVQQDPPVQLHLALSKRIPPHVHKDGCQIPCTHTHTHTHTDSPYAAGARRRTCAGTLTRPVHSWREPVHSSSHASSSKCNHRDQQIDVRPPPRLMDEEKLIVARRVHNRNACVMVVSLGLGAFNGYAGIKTALLNMTAFAVLVAVLLRNVRS